MSLEDRAEVLSLANQSVKDGLEQKKVCEVIGINERTLQRWRMSPVDMRKGPGSSPKNKLSEEEKARLIAVATGEEFRDKSPRQIVPTLADRGEYLASESTFYRVLKCNELLAHRGKQSPRHRPQLRALTATGPNQVLSWDITYLLSDVRGKFNYLYLFLDIFSRKIVGWAVHDREDSELSSDLLTEICETEGIAKDQVIVHADNGGPMKGSTMLATMQKLGVVPSFSRPSVSNDNPFSESLFKTLKYCPQYPSKPFVSLEAASLWVGNFVRWYNNEHLHSGINFVTPESKHQQKDVEILNKRKLVYEDAKKKNPSRWSGEVKNFEPVRVVELNHLKEETSSNTKFSGQLVS